MRDELKRAFDAVRAEEDRKQRTAALVRRQLAARRRGRSLAPLAVCAACLVLLLGTGGWLFLTPTAHVSIDINPSLELSLNRFDQVLSVEGYNPDGEKLAQGLDLRFFRYGEALDRILAQGTIAELLSGDGVLTITVVGEDERQQIRLLAGAEDCTAEQENAYCFTAHQEEADSAHALGLSCGKYRAYLELTALDPEITVQQVDAMTMRQIQTLLAELTGGESDEVWSQGHHGSGHGRGKGH